MAFRLGKDKKVNRISRVDFHAPSSLLDGDFKTLVIQVDTLIYSLPNFISRPKGLVIESATVGTNKEFENVVAYFWFDGYKGVRLTKVGETVDICAFGINKLNDQKSEIDKGATENQMPADKRTLGWA